MTSSNMESQNENAPPEDHSLSFVRDMDRSFHRLRRLIGMESMTTSSNDNDDDQSKSRVEDKNQSLTLTSLRKLIDGGPSFCNPRTASKKKKKNAASSRLQNSNVASRAGSGVFCDPNRSYYDDSEEEDEENSWTGITSRGILDVSTTSTDFILQDTTRHDETTVIATINESPATYASSSVPSLLAPQSTWSSSTTATNSNSTRTPFGTSSSTKYQQHHHHQSTTGCTRSPVNIPVSPIPYSPDVDSVHHKTYNTEENEDQQNHIPVQAETPQTYQSVSRAIFKEFETEQREDSNTEDHIVSDEDESDMEEHDVISSGVVIRDEREMKSKQGHPRKRHSILKMLSVIISTVIILVGGLLFRLHSIGKLDILLNHWNNNTLNTTITKNLLLDATGTNKINMTSHHNELENMFHQTCNTTQTHIHNNVQDMLMYLHHWQNHLLEKMYICQERIHSSWNSTTSSLTTTTSEWKHMMNFTKYYSDLERTMNLTIVLEMFSELSSSTWGTMEEGISQLKEQIPRELPTNLTNSLLLTLGKTNLAHMNTTWTAINSHILSINWSSYFEEIETTVTSTIGEENIDLFYVKLSEMDIVLKNIQSNLTKYYNESTLSLEKKFFSFLGPESMSILNKTWTEIQANLSLYYEESGLKKYLHSSNSTYWEFRVKSDYDLRKEVVPATQIKEVEFELIDHVEEVAEEHPELYQNDHVISKRDAVEEELYMQGAKKFVDLDAQLDRAGEEKWSIVDDDADESPSEANAENGAYLEENKRDSITDGEIFQPHEEEFPENLAEAPGVEDIKFQQDISLSMDKHCVDDIVVSTEAYGKTFTEEKEFVENEEPQSIDISVEEDKSIRRAREEDQDDSSVVEENGSIAKDTIESVNDVSSVVDQNSGPLFKIKSVFRRALRKGKIDENAEKTQKEIDKLKKALNEMLGSTERDNTYSPDVIHMAEVAFEQLYQQKH